MNESLTTKQIIAARILKLSREITGMDITTKVYAYTSAELYKWIKLLNDSGYSGVLYGTGDNYIKFVEAMDVMRRGGVVQCMGRKLNIRNGTVFCNGEEIEEKTWFNCTLSDMWEIVSE